MTLGLSLLIIGGCGTFYQIVKLHNEEVKIQTMSFNNFVKEGVIK